jgi:solute carrier family 35, member C2
VALLQGWISVWETHLSNLSHSPSIVRSTETRCKVGKRANMRIAMCKSSALAFVLLFAFIFHLETPTWRLVAIIATMTIGVIMMVAGEVEFHLGGFFLIISSAFFSGFRWGLTQILLLRHPLTSNPFASIFFLSPVMFLTLFLIALPSEGFLNFWEGIKMLSAEWGAFKTPLLLLFPGTIAFLMTASEFALLQRSSVVTLSIAGIFKEVVTIIVAALVFDDKLTPINISGLLVTLVAIAAYNYIKFTKMRDEAQRDAHKQAHSSDSSTERCSDSDEEDAGLLAHREESEFGGGSHITIDGDLLPKPKTPRPQEDSGRQTRTAEHERED